MNKSEMYEGRYNFGTLAPFCLTVSQVTRLKKIVKVTKCAFHISLQVLFTFHFHKHLASYISDMLKNAGESSCKLSVTVVRF
jgi:hypothetical protein